MSANAEIIAELRRVLNERDEAREQLDLTKRELGRWVDRETKAVRERDEARAEVERLHLDVGCLQLGLTVTSEAYRAGYMAGSRDAFRRGAEAMREACIGYAHKIGFHGLTVDIRALPIPEEP